MADLLSPRPGRQTREEVTRYVDVLKRFAAAQLTVSQARQEVRQSKDARLKKRVDRFFEKSRQSGQPAKIEDAVIAFIESGDFDAFFKARGRDEMLKPVDDHGTDLAKRFADAVRDTDQAGAEFILEHKRFLAWKRSMSVVLTAEGQAMIDVELATQLDALGEQTVMVWASVVRFPAWNKIAIKEAAPKGTAEVTTAKEVETADPASSAK